MKAYIKGNVMYFDADAWALVLTHAKRMHKSPSYVVHAALKRRIKLARKQGQDESLSSHR